MEDKLTRSEYIGLVYVDVIRACKGTGLFPSLMIAQGILESGNGNSKLARVYNNHFGIKASKGWTGDEDLMPTVEYVNKKPVSVKAPFRSYPTLEKGFRDRVNFLQVNPRYAKAGVFAAKTPAEQARCFQTAGYATDPAYASLLISIMKGSQLEHFDAM